MDKKQTTEVNTSTQEYFRPAEAAEYLGISTRTLYSLLSSGKLHAIKLTARVTLISKREMEQMIERTIGASLSESIFSKGRSGSFSSDVSHVKGRQHPPGEASGQLQTVHQQVLHMTHIILWPRSALSMTIVTVGSIRSACVMASLRSMLSEQAAFPRRRLTRR